MSHGNNQLFETQHETAIPAVRQLAEDGAPEIRSLKLEPTTWCQLQCRHCYNNSGYQGDEGTMQPDDWERVIGQGAELNIPMVQLIGGEVTFYKALPRLIGHALLKGMQVEVLSNLRDVRPDVWQALRQPGVRVAFSYYSSTPRTHDDFVGKPHSLAKTRANILKAKGYGIPLRANIVLPPDSEEDLEIIYYDLMSLGVHEENIGFDYVRKFGRAAENDAVRAEELCGNCGTTTLAVLSNGDVQPCVMSRWPDMTVGNVHQQSLSDVVNSEQLREVRAGLYRIFAGSDMMQCPPNNGGDCRPEHNPRPDCRPECGPNYEPCRPHGN